MMAQMADIVVDPVKSVELGPNISTPIDIAEAFW
jgi:hypothetical protein